MAIDYKREWEELLKSYGSKNVITYHPNKKVRLRDLMHLQIQGTIDDREKLMEEYVKAKIETEIIGADGGCHRVRLDVLGEPRGTITISKNAFNTWLRNKKKGDK